MTEIDTLPATYRGRPANQARRRERMSAILAAARGCIAAHGFHAATTARIAKAAGVSEANLFQYFATKDALIAAIADDNLARDHALVGMLAEHADLFEGLEAVIEGFLADETALDDLRVRSEIFTEALRNPALQAVIARGEDDIAIELARIVETARQRGEIRKDRDPAAIASLILCIFDGICGRAGAGAAHARSAASAAIALLRSGLSANSRER
jgi:TetR/AcrR family transcriptional regulator, repressor for uid operon